MSSSSSGQYGWTTFPSILYRYMCHYNWGQAFGVWTHRSDVCHFHTLLIKIFHETCHYLSLCIKRVSVRRQQKIGIKDQMTELQNGGAWNYELWLWRELFTKRWGVLALDFTQKANKLPLCLNHDVCLVWYNGLQATTQFSCSCSLSPVAGVTLLFFIFPSRQPLPRALVKMSALLKVQTKKSREGSEMPKLPFSASLSILLFPWKIDSINKNLFWEHLPGLKI